MPPTAAAIIRAHEEWKGCRPDQCTRECPHLAPKKRPSQSLCLRYAEHLAAAAESVLVEDVKKAWVEAYSNSDAKEASDANANG
jgi:hypothetical protein